MTTLKKYLATSAGLLGAFAALTLTTTLSAQEPKSQSDTQVLVLDEEVRLDWIEKSNVAALRQGVIDEMELQIGMPVVKGGLIGSLHKEIAVLTVRKAQLVAKSVGPLNKAEAQKSLALAVVAINERLNKRIKGSVSMEEMKKAEAELNVAHAMTVEAKEKIEQDKADLDLAERTLEEHRIVAPFDGIVLERHKNPGESVQANEAVVTIGNLDKIRAWTYVPTEYAFRVKEGQVVEIEPKLASFGKSAQNRTKRYRGKITFVDVEIQPVGESTVRVYAELDNKDHELRPGFRATMSIYLGSDAAAVPANAVGARTSSSGAGR